MDADRSTTGPLTWAWMLVVFAMVTTLSARAAGIFVGGGAAALLGATAGIAATAAVYYLWVSLKGNVAAKAFVAAAVVIATAVSVLAVQAMHERRHQALRPAAAQQPTPEIVDPFKQSAVDVPLAEAEWNTAINAWQARNATFLADPARRKAMDAAVQELDRSSPGLSDAELIRRAEALAFERTGWR